MTSDKTYYESQFERIEAIREDMRKGKILSRARDRKYEVEGSRGNRQAWLIAPDLGYPVKVIDAHVSEIPPGSHTGMHRHMCEAIIYILEGRGYSVIGDREEDFEKFEWEQSDAFCVPAFFWHQHYNSDPAKKAVYYAVTANPLTESLGVAKFEHHERRPPGK